jgi:hypothetical protein
MMRLCAPEMSRSMADWASSASLVIESHSGGSQFEVTMVAIAVPLDDEFVEVADLAPADLRGGYLGPDGSMSWGFGSVVGPLLGTNVS